MLHYNATRESLQHTTFFTLYPLHLQDEALHEVEVDQEADEEVNLDWAEKDQEPSPLNHTNTPVSTLPREKNIYSLLET